MSTEGSGTKGIVAKLTIVDVTEADVIQNQWYTMFQGYNVEIHALYMGVTTNNETLTMRITIDGIVLTSADTAVVAAQWSNLTNWRYGLTILMGVSAANADIGSTTYFHNMKGQNVKIELRKTTNLAGTSDLRLWGTYSQW